MVKRDTKQKAPASAAAKAAAATALDIHRAKSLSGAHQDALEYAGQMCALGKLDGCMCPVPGLPATNVTSFSSVEVLKTTSDAAGYNYSLIHPHLVGGTLNGAVITAGATPAGWGGADAQDLANFSSNVYWQRLVGIEVSITYLGNDTTDVKGTVQVGWVTHPASHASQQLAALMDEPSMQNAHRVNLVASGGSIVYRPPMMTDTYPQWETVTQSTSANTSGRPAWPSVAIVVMGAAATTDLYRLKVVRKYDIVPISGGVMRSMTKDQQSNGGLKDFAQNLWAKTSGVWSAVPEQVKSAGQTLLRGAATLAASTIVGATSAGLPALMQAAPLLLGI